MSLGNHNVLYVEVQTVKYNFSYQDKSRDWSFVFLLKYHRLKILIAAVCNQNAILRSTNVSLYLSANSEMFCYPIHMTMFNFSKYIRYWHRINLRMCLKKSLDFKHIVVNGKMFNTTTDGASNNFVPSCNSCCYVERKYGWVYVFLKEVWVLERS